MSEDDIKQLMNEAFAQAFQAQLGQLYKVYISNALSTPEQAQQNAKRGIEGAVKAYKLAIAAVNSWEG
jgi:hypothetical protein